jgi:hypothetical protein
MKKPTVTPEASMLLFTSFWNDATTFKLLPTTEECPFVEVIYDPSLEMLVVINKNSKSTFHNVPKLDDNGDVMMMKTAARANGKPFKEERRTVETYQEYYLTEKEEQIAFIKMFAVNAETFDFEKFMANKDKAAVYQPETIGLVDENGLPMKK